MQLKAPPPTTRPPRSGPLHRGRVSLLRRFQRCGLLGAELLQRPRQLRGAKAEGWVYKQIHLLDQETDIYMYPLKDIGIYIYVYIHMYI